MVGSNHIPGSTYSGIKVKKNLLTEILFALQPSHVQCVKHVPG